MRMQLYGTSLPRIVPGAFVPMVAERRHSRNLVDGWAYQRWRTILKELTIAALLIATPAVAYSAPRMSCATVRAYVAQYGAQQARQMGRAVGMTASEERQAVQCLAANHHHRSRGYYE
jgi:hypothetical protein